jgi:cell division protein FtsW
MIGALAVLAMFVLLGVLGIRIALHAQDNFGTLLAAGITSWIMLEATLNIAASVGLMPVTGSALPFLSSGGSNLFVVLCAVGVLLSVARHADVKAPVSRRTTSGKKSRVKA